MKPVTCIYCNPDKPEVGPVLHRLVEILKTYDAEIYIDRKAALEQGYAEYARSEEDLCKGDVLFVLGGDGTIIGLSRRMANTDIPLFTVNLGHTGYLTETGIDGMEEAIAKYFNNNYYIETRDMLAVSVDGGPWRRCLNEATIYKSNFNSIRSMTIVVNGEEFQHFPGDGLIVATPTGSTAYSLSAGGPLVNPTVACVLMTPISPGNLHTRPFVLSNGDCIRVEVKTQGMAPTLYLDGQDSYPLTQNCVLHFQKAKESIRFIRIEGRRGMFTTLKEKLYTL